MARGRKRDLTAPPSRQLSQQRAYRDRRAAYVSDLEERVRVAEEENAKLKAEVSELRAALHSGADVGRVRDAELVKATAELQQKLRDVSANIASYQQLIMAPRTTTPTILPSPQTSEDRCCDDMDENPMECILGIIAAAQSNSTNSQTIMQPLAQDLDEHDSIFASDGECCGGLINCDGLILEEGDDGTGDNTRQPLVLTSPRMAPTSHVRAQP